MQVPKFVVFISNSLDSLLTGVVLHNQLIISCRDFWHIIFPNFKSVLISYISLHLGVKLEWLSWTLFGRIDGKGKEKSMTGRTYLVKTFIWKIFIGFSTTGT